MATPVALPGRPWLTASCAAAGAGLAWWRWGGPWLAALAILTLALLVFAIAFPRAYRPVNAVFEGVLRLLLQGLSWLLLGAVFVTIFIPGRALLALRSRDPLGLRPDRSKSTYWQAVAPTADESRRFSRQF